MCGVVGSEMAVVISDQLRERSNRLLDAEPDEHLLALIRAGHETAFAAIVRRYERELLAQARRLSSGGRGEDAVQQVFLNAFAALQAGGEVRHLRGWLHQILRNVVVRARVPVDVPLESVSAEGESVEEAVQRRADAHATLVGLSALPDRQREALLGTAVLGLPRSQVAQRMGLSEGAVRQLVHRARLRLRQAATALVPLPVARWCGLARSAGGAAGSEAAIGAGTAASGGLAIKVGTLVASGVVATGLAVTHSLPGHHSHSAAPPRPSAAARHRGSVGRSPLRASTIAASGPVARPDTSAGATRRPAGDAVSVQHDDRLAGGRDRHQAGRGRGGPGSGRRQDGRGHDAGIRSEPGSGPAGRPLRRGTDRGPRPQRPPSSSPSRARAS